VRAQGVRHREKESEFRSQEKREIRDQKSEVRDQRTKDRISDCGFGIWKL
jgi:hypothetical protein